jgi:myo-inositol-1(or 4)-monophosphatase
LMKAAELATPLLLEFFNGIRTPDIESKSSQVDLVSTADRQAEQLIREVLMEALPGADFLGEESHHIEKTGAEYRWVVDPLDGTSNFLSGLPLWSISIALTNAGYQPLAGLVAAPVLGKTWIAIKGAGCECNGRPCFVRRQPPGGGMHNSMLATGFPYVVSGGKADINLANFIHMQRRFHKIRRLGSAAIDLALIAEGVFDGMWELMLQPWDSAAGILLVSEAGGCVSRFDGRAFTPGDEDLLAAGSIELLGVLQKELAIAAAQSVT